MTHRAAQFIAPEERQKKRRTKLRGWTRLLTYVLAGLCLTAIWQEKRLAPPVHDGMQRVVGIAMHYIDQNEALSDVLADLQEGYEKLANDG
ncbi:hypothetical protein [Roseovarius sp. 2305UL8-3]|uniref:hypothetical protein n=1 Tax=Roseovarius conchicola TaxID=3121636 RepID=UPI003527C685